jgi:hypothetical protein
MNFHIRMGVPEMAAFWEDLTNCYQLDTLTSDQKKSFKKLVKVLDLLRSNPRHNSLKTHEIEELTGKYGFKIFQSYIENKTPSARRIFWAYGPEKSDITILGIEPHPENTKRGAYKRIKLSHKP